MGAYYLKTHIGHRYFLTVVDDFSRATWTYFMVTKDEAISIIKSFLTMAKTQFASILKVFRIYNVLESSNNHENLDFFAKTCILYQTSRIQTPQ